MKILFYNKKCVNILMYNHAQWHNYLKEPFQHLIQSLFKFIKSDKQKVNNKKPL